MESVAVFCTRGQDGAGRAPKQRQEDGALPSHVR